MNESPIRKFRKAANMTQSQLGKLAKLKQSRLSHYERLERLPDIFTARRLVRVFRAHGLDVSVDDIYPSGEQVA